jgi:hypothetical protein
MNDDELSPNENARRKRLKIWALVSCGASLVAMLGLMAVTWSYGAGWSRSARHDWQDFFELMLGCCIAWQLMLAQKVDWKGAPSPLSTLGLSQRTAGPIAPVRSEDWKREQGSEAR